MTENVLELFLDSCAEDPHRLAFIGPRAQRITFRELELQINRVARGLSCAGLRAGDRVVVMIPMSVDLYISLLSVFKIGAVAVFVDPWLSLRTISAFAGFSEPKGFIGLPRSHVLRFLDRRLSRIKIAISTRSFLAIPSPLSLKSLGGAEKEEHLSDLSFSAQEHSPALITFTSGSSGDPKGANRTHGFLLEQHRALKGIIPYGVGDIDLSMFPVFALNNLASGVTTIIPDMDFRNVGGVNPARLFKQFAAERVTTCTASPPLIDSLVDYLARTNKSLPNLRRIVTGGAPISDSMLQRWSEVLKTVEVMIAYGSTEAEPVAHISLQERLALPDSQKGYCMGKMVPQIRARLIRISKERISLADVPWEALEVRPGEVGELIVSGDHVCKEYYQNHEAFLDNKLLESDGTVWHRMGDTGYFDDAGRFWLTGRVHSTICLKGCMLHPQVIEQIVVTALRDKSVKVAALGMPSSVGDDQLVIVTTGAVNKQLISECLRAEGIIADQIITNFSKLPMDPRHNSKVDYSKLRELLKWRG